MPAPFQNRGEEMFRRSEFYIDDNLDSVIRKKDRYSLYFKGEDDNFERHAYYRISGKLLKPGELTVTLPVVKKQGLTVSGNGDFGVEIELFYRKPGRAAADIYDKPDTVLYMPVSEGTGKYQMVSETFTLPENVACAFLRIGGTHFSGECWVEAPRLIQNKKNRTTTTTGLAVTSQPAAGRCGSSNLTGRRFSKETSSTALPMWRTSISRFRLPCMAVER